MSELETITNQMNRLAVVIAGQQAYITKHGEANDAGEYDKQWEQYKEEAKQNLAEWDRLKQKRDDLFLAYHGRKQ